MQTILIYSGSMFPYSHRNNIFKFSKHKTDLSQQYKSLLILVQLFKVYFGYPLGLHELEIVFLMPAAFMLRRALQLR